MWKYFGFTHDKEGRQTNCCFPKCKICFKDVSVKFGNTSNLLKHLQLHHVSEFGTITQLMPKKRNLLSHHVRLSLKKTSCAMIGALNPRYRLPHKDYFSRIAIPELYEKTRKQFLVKIQEEAHFFSAATNLWSSCSSDPYL